MATDNTDWSLFRSFITVLREGSLSAAARALGLGQSTLSRHIATLESGLGLTLFTRSSDGLVPTAAALALRPEAEALAAAANSLFRAASGPLNENVGTVRIAASDMMAVEVLPSILASLQREHPQIVVELAVSSRMDDLQRRDADIAVRMARPSQEALVAQRIGASELGLFAHPGYLAHQGTPTTLSELAEHAFVGFDVGAAYTDTLQLDGQRLTRERFSLRTDNDLAQFAAICSGCGVGACHAILAERAELVRILPALFAPKVDMWVAMHKDLRSTARYRTVFDALKVGLTAYLASAKAAA